MKNSNKVAGTVFLLVVAVVSIPVLVIVCIAVGLFHSWRFLGESIMEIIKTIKWIWIQ